MKRRDFAALPLLLAPLTGPSSGQVESAFVTAR